MRGKSIALYKSLKRVLDTSSNIACQCKEENKQKEKASQNIRSNPANTFLISDEYIASGRTYQQLLHTNKCYCSQKA